MALIPPFFFDCVAAIGFKDISGNINYGATGFLFGKLITKGTTPDKSEYRIYLITNRHVFEGNLIATLRFNPTALTPGQTFDLNLIDESNRPKYSLHTDPEIDIAVIRINYNLLSQKGMQINFFQEDNHTNLIHQASQNGIAEGDGIFVLGFPMGDVGKDRNYVVARQGCLARIRDTVVGVNKHFLGDVTILPGNSGGPVVSKPEMVAISGTSNHTNACLIGIIAGYLPYQDVAISQQTKKPRIVFEENSGLAIIYPVDRIIEIVDSADQILQSQIVANKGTSVA